MVVFVVTEFVIIELERTTKQKLNKKWTDPNAPTASLRILSESSAIKFSGLSVAVFRGCLSFCTAATTRSLGSSSIGWPTSLRLRWRWCLARSKSLGWWCMSTRPTRSGRCWSHIRKKGSASAFSWRKSVTDTSKASKGLSGQKSHSL